MNAHSPSMAAFVLRTLLWLPACFVAWYLCAPYHATLVGMMARLLLGAIAPGIVSAVDLAGSDLAFVTTLEVRSAGDIERFIEQRRAEKKTPSPQAESD